MQSNGALGLPLAMECNERGEVQIGEDIAVDDDKSSVNSSVASGESHCASRIERFGLYCVGQIDPGGASVVVRLLERVGEIAQRQDGLFDTMRPQMGQHSFDHRHPDDR